MGTETCHMISFPDSQSLIDWRLFPFTEICHKFCFPAVVSGAILTDIFFFIWGALLPHFIRSHLP